MNGKDLFKVLDEKNVPAWIDNSLCKAKEIIDGVMDFFQDEVGGIGDEDIALDESEQFILTTNQKAHKVIKINAYCVTFEDGEKCFYGDMTAGETLDFLTKVGFMFEDIENKNNKED